MKTIIGITGTIGAGKSTLVQHLSKHPNIHVFDCDAAVVELYNDPDIVNQLELQFGSSQREILRGIFIKQQNVIHLRQINEIFADAITDKFLKWASGRCGVILLDAPMLFENNMDIVCDTVIQLSVDTPLRFDRIKDRNQDTGELFNLINAYQWCDDRREKAADYTIVSNVHTKFNRIVAMVNDVISPFLPKTAIYAGSFDPITKGHVDIITKAAAMFDILYVCVGINEQKTHALDSKTRMELIEQETAHIHNIAIECYSDALLAAARRCGATHIVRGIRNDADAINELNMCGIHNAADPSIQTVFIPADPKFQYVSSSAAKVLLRSHTSNDPQGVVDVSWMISDNVRNKLMKQMIYDHSHDNSFTANR